MINEDLEFTIQRGTMDNRKRELVLNPQFLKFESNDLKTNLYVVFEKNEIVEFRYGMKWITFKATFGREYFIYIKNKQDKIIKINFATYFGRKKVEYHKLYSDIIKTLRQFYFNNIVNELIAEYEQSKTITIGEVELDKEGVKINISGILNVTPKNIPWKNVRTKDFITYFTIYSVEDPSKINRGYSYLEDWNTSVLHSVLRTILKNKGIESYNYNS